MKWYHEFIHQAPEELNGFFAMLEVPVPPFPDSLKDRKVCGIVWCYCGDLDEAEEVFKPILEFNEPLFSMVGPMPYPAIQSLFDPLMPPGMQWYWRADFFKELNSELGPVHQDFGSGIPTTLSQMHLYPISGEASRPGDSETPWAYRDAKYAGVIVGIDPDPEKAELITEWCKGYFDATHPYSMKGAYSNFMMDEGKERVKASFRHNYKRLVDLKRKYDPTNFFRVNQNIAPH
jgi:hypothetical protein